MGLSIVGRFIVDSNPDLASAKSLTVLTLFDESPGAGEAVGDLAITLVADPRNHGGVGDLCDTQGLDPLRWPK